MRTDFDPEVDYYEILQVHPKAHPEIIKRAYRTLVAQLHAHPDLGGSHQQMVAINRAYEVLSRPELRAEYDRSRQAHDGSTSAGAAHRREPATANPPPPAATVSCATCGRRNRVPRTVDFSRARCGSCGKRLMTPPATRAEASPDPHAANGVPRGRAAAHRLPQELYNELLRNGELRVELSRIARGSRVVCRRCRRPWWAQHSGKPPDQCPNCQSGEWLTFRLFKCALCEHEWESDDLSTWAYDLHPACPACGARDWHRAAQRNPVRRFIRRLGRR